MAPNRALLVERLIILIRPVTHPNVTWRQPGSDLQCQKQQRCSRICSCRSTQKPQRSTGFGSCALNISIEITYFHPISTNFNKRSDLFWDRWSHPHKIYEMNGLQRRVVEICWSLWFSQLQFWRLCSGFCWRDHVNFLSGLSGVSLELLAKDSL